MVVIVVGRWLFLFWWYVVVLLLIVLKGFWIIFKCKISSRDLRHPTKQSIKQSPGPGVQNTYSPNSVTSWSRPHLSTSAGPPWRSGQLMRRASVPVTWSRQTVLCPLQHQSNEHPGALHTACWILNSAQCLHYTAHCTLHTAHCTLHTAHCTLRTASFILDTAHTH